MRQHLGIGNLNREATLKWLRANGLDPGEMPATAPIEVEGDQIIVHYVVRQPVTRKIVRSGNGPLTRPVTTQQRHPLSEFTAPLRKPAADVDLAGFAVQSSLDGEMTLEHCGELTAACGWEVAITNGVTLPQLAALARDNVAAKHPGT